MSGGSKLSTEGEFKGPFEALYELGLALFVDDAHDLARGPFRSVEEIRRGEAPIHHWVWGAALCIFSALGKVWYAFECSRQATKVFRKV